MIEVSWERDEGAYIVTQDGEFIKDDDNLYFALKFALEVADAAFKKWPHPVETVTVLSVE